MDIFGMEADAHAGDWHRQISLLAGESIDTVKETLPTLKNGAFAENIITRGIDLTQLSVGDRLQVGDTIILEITQIGKECHNSGCAIKKATGDCIMPREGLFAKVVTGGTISSADHIQVMV
jgi:MOSC domain-containing protein YiiM